MKHILVADIGGTNIRLAIYHKGRLSDVTILKTAAFKRPTDAFDSYMTSQKIKPTYMILGVAGPVDKGAVCLTNSGWQIKEKQMEKHYDLVKCTLVNDFVLKGYAALSLEPGDYIRLNTNKIQKNAPKCVIGPGTGLGVCFLTYENNIWTAHPSEAGHTDIAANTPVQHQLIKQMRPNGTNISAEDILSGSGLVRLYHAVATINQQPDHPVIPEDLPVLAQQGDKTALEAYRHFFDFLAVFAGNMAIALKTTGGIYLTSSILRHDYILDLFTRHSFQSLFENHGKMQKLAAQVPVFFITRPQSAFLGLKKLARQLDESKN